MGAAASKKVDEKLSNGIQNALNNKWVPIFMKLNGEKTGVDYASIVGENLIQADTIDNLANNFTINAQEATVQNQNNSDDSSADAANPTAAANPAAPKLSMWDKQKQHWAKQKEQYQRDREKVAGVAAAAGRGAAAAGRSAAAFGSAAASAAGRGLGAAGRSLGAAAGVAGRAAGRGAAAAGRGAAAFGSAAAAAAGRGLGAAGRGIGAAAAAAGHGIGAAATAARNLTRRNPRARNTASAAFTRRTPRSGSAAAAKIAPIARNPLHPKAFTPEARAKAQQRALNRAAASENVNLSNTALLKNNQDDLEQGQAQPGNPPVNDSIYRNTLGANQQANPPANPQGQARELKYEPIDAVREKMDGGYRKTRRRR